jgi:hypothetical protein
MRPTPMAMVSRPISMNAIPAGINVRFAVILGAGGASRAVVQAVRDRGFKTIHVVNRTVSRARRTGRSLRKDGVHPHPMEALSEVMKGAGLFVNTTSLGMDGRQLPEIDFSVLRPAHRDRHCLCAAEDADPRASGKRRVLRRRWSRHVAASGGSRFEKWFGSGRRSMIPCGH